MDGKLCIRLLRAVVAVCLLGFFLSPADVWSQKWLKKAENKCWKAKRKDDKKCDELLGKAFAVDMSDEDKKFKAMQRAYDCRDTVCEAFDRCSGKVKKYQKWIENSKNPKKMSKALMNYEKSLDNCAKVHLKELKKKCPKLKKNKDINKCVRDSTKKINDCQKKAREDVVEKILKIEK